MSASPHSSHSSSRRSHQNNNIDGNPYSEWSDEEKEDRRAADAPATPAQLKAEGTTALERNRDAAVLLAQAAPTSAPAMSAALAAIAAVATSGYVHPSRAQPEVRPLDCRAVARVVVTKKEQAAKTATPLAMALTTAGPPGVRASLAMLSVHPQASRWVTYDARAATGHRAGTLVLRALINGKNARCLVDTGATGCFMSSRFARRFDPEGFETGNFGQVREAFGGVSALTRMLPNATGSLLGTNPAGAATSFTWTGEYFIVQLEAYDVILGLTMLQPAKALVDLDTRTVVVKDTAGNHIRVPEARRGTHAPSARMLRHQLARLQLDIRPAATSFALPLAAATSLTAASAAPEDLPFVLTTADLYNELQQANHGLEVSALYMKTGPVMPWYEVS